MVEIVGSTSGRSLNVHHIRASHFLGEFKLGLLNFRTLFGVYWAQALNGLTLRRTVPLEV